MPASHAQQPPQRTRLYKRLRRPCLCVGLLRDSGQPHGRRPRLTTYAVQSTAQPDGGTPSLYAASASGAGLLPQRRPPAPVGRRAAVPPPARRCCGLPLPLRGSAGDTPVPRLHLYAYYLTLILGGSIFGLLALFASDLFNYLTYYKCTYFCRLSISMLVRSAFLHIFPILHIYATFFLYLFIYVRIFCDLYYV